MGIIDLFPLSEDAVRQQFPSVYQWILERVKPGRMAKAGQSKDADQYAAKWWLFGKPRESMRNAIAGLESYIVTVKTARHRWFVFMDRAVLPDSKLIAFASADGFDLGILSSRIHTAWTNAAGAHLGAGNDPTYVIGTSFLKFPFPMPDGDHKERIRRLAIQLNDHRAARLQAHPDLTMTGMYNVLQMLREGTALSEKDRLIHEQGLVAVLCEIHDELDRLVAGAYGWPADLSDDEILLRLVHLNAERAREEAAGRILWVRPEFQAVSRGAEQQSLDVLKPSSGKKSAAGPAAKLEWPAELPAQVGAVRGALVDAGAPVTAEEMARRFTRVRSAKVTPILDTLVAMGKARLTPDGRYSCS